MAQNSEDVQYAGHRQCTVHKGIGHIDAGHVVACARLCQLDAVHDQEDGEAHHTHSGQDIGDEHTSLAQLFVKHGNGQISDVLNVAMSFEDFSDRLLQQYGITVKESRGQLSYLPAGRKKFIRAHSLGDKFEKELVLATLKENAKSQPIILHNNLEEEPDRIKKLVDIQAKLKQGKGIGYERWAKKHNLKTMAQTLILLQDKGLLNEDALDQRIAELDTKFHESLAVVKDLETRMAENKTLRSHAAAYKQYRPLAQKRNAAKSPAAFEEQHRVELTAYRAAAAYLKANNITSLPSPNKLESEYCALASEKAQFYEQYKEAKSELLKLKDAKQNVALFFREEKQTQHHEREGVCV